MEISWETATKTANRNVRVAGTVRIVRDGGQWEYRLNETARKGTWWALNLQTGERIRTGQTTMTDLKAFMYDLHVARGGNKGVTIASGPERARVGHQRFNQYHTAHAAPAASAPAATAKEGEMTTPAAEETKTVELVDNELRAFLLDMARLGRTTDSLRISIGSKGLRMQVDGGRWTPSCGHVERPRGGAPKLAVA